MYEQAVAESERTGVKRDININKSDKAKVIKDKFEKGEIVNNENEEVDEKNTNVLTENGDEDEISVFDAGKWKNEKYTLAFILLLLCFFYKYCSLFILGISKKSRSLFMELDANAVKTKNVAPVMNTTKKEYISNKQVSSYSVKMFYQ